MPQLNDFDKTLLPIELEIAWVYERDLAQDWLLQAPEAIKKISPKRLREYAASRQALAEVCHLQSYEELEILNHLHLLRDPEIKVSLSHTRGLACAAASRAVTSLGIDLEFKDREFNSQVAKFFLLQDDIELPLLQLWGIKEAAFKAIAPLNLHQGIKEVLVLKDLTVTAHSIVLAGKEVARWHLQQHGELQTAIAWVP